MLLSTRCKPVGDRGPKPKFRDVACPNEECPDHGTAGEGNVVGNGTYDTKSGKVRKFICKTCGGNFCSRTNTAFYDLRTEDEEVLLALKMVLKGLGLRDIAEILDVKLDTVRGWLKRAAEHSEEVNAVLMKELDVSKVEMDELWTYVKKNEFREWKKQRKEKFGNG